MAFNVKNVVTEASNLAAIEAAKAAAVDVIVTLTALETKYKADADEKVAKSAGVVNSIIKKLKVIEEKGLLPAATPADLADLKSINKWIEANNLGQLYKDNKGVSVLRVNARGASAGAKDQEGISLFPMIIPYVSLSKSQFVGLDEYHTWSIETKDGTKETVAITKSFEGVKSGTMFIKEVTTTIEGNKVTFLKVFVSNDESLGKCWLSIA